MAGDKLTIDKSQMKEQAEKVQSAVSTYKSFGNKPFDVEIEYLDGMNTDFTAKLVTMLEDLNEGNPELTEALEDIGELTQSIVDTFEKVDHDAAKDMKVTKEG